MILTYKYCLLPTKRQHKALTAICNEQRVLYNAALQERIDCYRKTGEVVETFSDKKSAKVRRDELNDLNYNIPEKTQEDPELLKKYHDGQAKKMETGGFKYKVSKGPDHYLTE